MSTKSWSGESDLLKALHELLDHHSTVPTSKIRAIVSIANKHIADFKMVVYEIEKFIRKSDDHNKIAGLFVIDSLCKQHSKERDIFSKRFALRLKDTFSYFSKLTTKDKGIVQRILEEWHKKDVFPSELVYALLQELGNEPMDDVGNGKGQMERNIIGKRKLINIERPEVKRASKVCPFKESCLFGEKCRFNHSDMNSLDQYPLRLAKSSRRGMLSMDSNQVEKFLPETILFCPAAPLTLSQFSRRSEENRPDSCRQFFVEHEEFLIGFL